MKGCEWHGMQGVRGSNPLSSTPGQRPSPASSARESALTQQPPLRDRHGRPRGRLPGPPSRGSSPGRPEELLPTMGGVLTAAALGQSPLGWRRAVGESTRPPSIRRDPPGPIPHGWPTSLTSRRTRVAQPPSSPTERITSPSRVRSVLGTGDVHGGSGPFADTEAVTGSNPVAPHHTGSDEPKRWSVRCLGAVRWAMYRVRSVSHA